MSKFEPSRMDRLLGSERSRWQNPDLIFDALGLGRGMYLADVGAGPGFFTLPAAARVGPKGKVYALDVEPRMLERLRERVAEAGLTNIEAVLSEEDHLPLSDGSIDAALVANVLHETRIPSGILREVMRVLRPGGVLGVVEWRKEEMEKGPPVTERLAPEQVAGLLQTAGFQTVEPFNVGPYHYGLRALKPQR